MIVADTDVLIDFLAGVEPLASRVGDEIEAGLATTAVTPIASHNHGKVVMRDDSRVVAGAQSGGAGAVEARAKYDAPARILVVDDHPMNCELMEAMLAPEGYRVDSVHSGAAALVSVREDPPALILLDVSMPEMDGFEVARRLRASEATRLIPIVMVTALGDLEHRVRGLEAGAEDSLSKPVNRSELLARVQSSLRLSYYHRQVDERQKLELVLADVSDGILVVDGAGGCGRPMAAPSGSWGSPTIRKVYP